MAIIKTRQMNRPNNSLNLFEHLDNELSNYNITSAEDLLRRSGHACRRLPERGF